MNFSSSPDASGAPLGWNLWLFNFRGARPCGHKAEAAKPRRSDLREKMKRTPISSVAAKPSGRARWRVIFFACQSHLRRARAGAPARAWKSAHPAIRVEETKDQRETDGFAAMKRRRRTAPVAPAALPGAPASSLRKSATGSGPTKSPNG